MSDMTITLLVFAAAIAAVAVIGIFKRNSRKRGQDDSNRREPAHVETERPPDRR